MIQPTGIAQLNGGATVNVYPNPTSGNATIEFKSKNTKAELSIENMLGQILFNKTISPTAGILYRELIDLKNYDAGLYLVKIKTATESGVLQLIKQ